LAATVDQTDIRPVGQVSVWATARYLIARNRWKPSATGEAADQESSCIQAESSPLRLPLKIVVSPVRFRPSPFHSNANSDLSCTLTVFVGDHGAVDSAISGFGVQIGVQTLARHAFVA
jgi:hypothetical protein